MKSKKCNEDIADSFGRAVKPSVINSLLRKSLDLSEEDGYVFLLKDAQTNKIHTVIDNLSQIELYGLLEFVKTNKMSAHLMDEYQQKHADKGE